MTPIRKDALTKMIRMIFLVLRELSIPPKVVPAVAFL